MHFVYKQLVAALVVIVCGSLVTLPARATVRLPRLISNGMVLQHGVNLDIWGWADTRERIVIRFGGKSYRTMAGVDGKWRVSLPAMEPGGPHTMTIVGENTIEIRDILVGDVWFCSGQSNMVHMLNTHDVEYATTIAEANDSTIRQFLVPSSNNLQEQQADFHSGSWISAEGENVRLFSVVAYFFAKDLHDRYQIPIGIINASVGGTPIEAWMSEDGLKDFPIAIRTIDYNKDTANVQRINRAAEVANMPAPSRDLGTLGEEKWFEMSYHPKGWRNINVPGYWEDQGIKDLDGVVWYRKVVHIPASMVGKAARVFLGRIVDADALYINGEQVGHTSYMYPQRRYPVPSNLLKEGDNIFVVRVTNQQGKGGFVPDKPYCIFSDQDTIDLKGTWQYRVGEVFDPEARRNTMVGINLQNQPSALFNGMVAPLINYQIKGVLWYQGESNVAHPAAYASLLPALISDWRKHWNNDQLPFLYVQLPGFMDYNYLPSESNWAVFRESQRQALSPPNTAMAVAIDLGEWNDIHPGRKGEIGERLARQARKLVYGESIVASGPSFNACSKVGNKVKIAFDDVGTGLTTADGEVLTEFAVAGVDGMFVWAEAIIDGDQVVVWNDDVPEPVYIRYAWADNPVNPNLCNKEGLPASPFEIKIK